MTWSREEYEEERRRRNEAKCPRASALRDRCIGASDFTDQAGVAQIVGLLDVLRWYLETGNEIPTSQAREVEAALERLGCGPFPRTA